MQERLILHRLCNYETENFGMLAINFKKYKSDII